MVTAARPGASGRSLDIGGLSWRRTALWLALLAIYVALDRMDAMLTPGPMQPTPWDLSGGLTFAVLLWEGPWFAPLAALAEFASARLSPGAHAPLAADLASAAFLAAAYAPAAVFLRRRGWTGLARQAELSALVLTVAAAAAARTGVDAVIANLALRGGNLPASPETLAVLLGERMTGAVAGVFVVAPVFIGLRTTPWRLEPRAAPEAVAQFAVLVGLCLVVTPPGQADTFRYFYLLFLPQIWIALRGGVLRAAVGNLIVQVALILFLLGRPDIAALSFNYQVRLLALALSSLFLAVAVAERRAAEAALRQRQDALARVSRLSLAGEMAATLAHELNQPLMAAIAYARTAQVLAGEGRDPRLDEALDGTVRQSERAGDIVRNLRRFVGRPDDVRGRHNLDDLLRETVDLVEPRRAATGARILRVVSRDVPLVAVDAIQLQQVVVNLLHNALESMARASVGPPVVKLVARAVAEGVEVETRDSGLGVDAAIAAGLFEPLVTDKADGMGLGLAISRGIIEAHGGRLWLAENRPGRCVIRFTLPRAAPETKP
ncbi:MAG: MASE1 domain-containing protein [Proteobacteria bacterium]|nr:MASE1 domain-containing protein [Pseudomonadota bacterium]